MTLTRLLITGLLLMAAGYIAIVLSSSPAEATAGLRCRAASGDLVASYIESRNRGTPEAMRAFEEKYRSARALGSHSMDGRLIQAMELHKRWGKLTLHQIIHSTPQAVIALIDSEHSGTMEFIFEFEPEEQGKLSVIRITKSAGLEPLDADIVRKTVEAVATTLTARYVFPEQAEQMASALRDNLARGAYALIKTQRELADQLTEELRAICGDKHLAVRPVPSTPAGQGARPAGAPAVQMGPPNAGFRKVEILDSNIGFIRFDGFAHGEDAERIAAAAMNFVANCDAVIFDLRHNGGGSPRLVRFISSYIFAEPTHLNSMYDRDGNMTEEFWTLADIPGKQLRPDVPVYVLTSSSTFSGAEEFAYNLQSRGRATIVGETTGGGAHPTARAQLNDQFFLAVPYLRAQNPITKTNWEGVGVVPEIAVPASEALERAIADFAGEPRAMVMRIE